MRKLFPYLKPYLLWFVALVVFVYGQVQATLALPDYMADIVNKGIIGADTNYVIQTGIMMLSVTLLGGLCTIAVGFTASRIATGFVKRLRSALFTQVENFSLHEFNTFSTASLITRATNDMQQLQQTVVLLLRLALIAPFTGVGAIIKAYQLSPDMSWIMAVSIGILVTIIVVLFAIVVPKFKEIQKLVDRLSLVTREMLTGIRVIRAFHKESSEEKKFDEANNQSVKLNLFVNRAMIILQPTMMLILSLTSLAIVWIGARYIDSGALQLGSLLAFMQYSAQAVGAFLMLSFIFILAPRALVSAGRISEVLASESTIADPARPQIIPTNGRGKVEFKDVSFGYQDSQEPVLSHISFVAEPGQTTAIVGGTGSGKSTLVNLIPRLYDATKGAILIDGVDIRDATQADVRSRIGYAAQKATLFSGTITSNISYASKMTHDRIVEAAKVAQADEFIENLPDKYKEQVARGGTNLSGGQKQRISIARAIAKKPAVYLFDDSFSALDMKTDAALRHALSQETKGKTVLIVAQRISSIMHADQIIVLDDGRIVDRGTHHSLLKSSKVYREIAESQLSAAELKESAS
ncbi:MAG: multidrug transporter ATP-binding protein [Candidatus Saccharibacteria bacterium]|nr:multidrug transporter ATP-binding protein [Candidatus Saccharibacteria bacterium]